MSAIHEDCSHYFENDLKSRRCWNQIIYVDHPETYCLRDKLCEVAYTVNREVNIFFLLFFNSYSEYFKRYMCLGYFVLVSVCAKIHPFIPESLIYFSTQTSQLRIGGDYDWPLSILQDYHGPDQAARLSFMNHFGIFLEHIVHEQVFSVLPGFVVKYQLDTAIL